MKPISYEEWVKRFDVKASAADELDEIASDPESFQCYDNGAVSDQEANFVIKADQTRPR